MSPSSWNGFLIPPAPPSLIESVTMLAHTFQFHSQALVLSLPAAFAKMNAGTSIMSSCSLPVLLANVDARRRCVRPPTTDLDRRGRASPARKNTRMPLGTSLNKVAELQRSFTSQAKGKFFSSHLHGRNLSCFRRR